MTDSDYNIPTITLEDMKRMEGLDGEVDKKRKRGGVMEVGMVMNKWVMVAVIVSIVIIFIWLCVLSGIPGRMMAMMVKK